MSPSCLALLGYTVEEIVAKRIEEFMEPASYERCIRIPARELEADKTGAVDPNRAVLQDVEYIRKDGSRVWAAAAATRSRPCLII